MRKLAVDRFEGEYAICEDEDQNYFAIPISELPSGTVEGLVLSVPEKGPISIDPEESARRRERIIKKQRRIFGM